MSGTNGDGVWSTGGQVDEIALALIDAANDNDQMTREVIANSLFDLGKKKPSLILSSCHTYLKKHSKLSLEHRIIILNTIERIVKETLDSVNSELAINLIKQASSELTQSKEVSPEWQTAASGVLVALGMKYCNDVMGEMLEKFQPGVLPHFFVVQTIGNLAAANVYDMVPHLTAVLGTMLPMLGLAKYDNMRWVFAAAISKFSEAILEYCANLDQAPDKTVSIDRFSNEIFSAYDILFNVWLQSKEAKLRLAIIEAVGHMTHIMNKDKLQEQLPKILQGIYSLYKRHPEPFHITQGLCMVLDAVCVEGSLILEPHLDNLLNILFSQIFQPVDYSNPMSLKNHNELLRSYAIIARAFSGKLVGILLGKLETKDEKIKIGILSIFKHVINAAVSAMEDKKEVIVSGLRGLCAETNNKVKKVFAQVIIAMAHRGYLELEGGHHMVEFIVRQCSLEDDPKGKKSPDPEYVSNQALRSMCDNILQLITTTVEEMESVLWPYLLELIVPEQYMPAVGPVCRSLAYLAHKKRDESAQDFWIDFESQPNIPKPAQIIARLLVLVGHPKNGCDRGIHILNLMKSICPNLHDNIIGLWDAVIPKLVSYLGVPESDDEDEGKVNEVEKWSQKNWEDLLLKMLSKSLDVVDNEDWIADLGIAIGQQIPIYANYVDERNFAFKCLGIIMRKSSKKDFVEKHLELIFNTVKHVDQTEREGCAVAVGYVASSHLDTVLSRLEKVAKNDMTKKSSGILGILKDKSEVNTEQVKATLMLCYGFVALYSPPSLIISRMEATILRSISPYYPTVKETNVKQNLIRCTDLIAQALNPAHLEQEYRFTTRGEFLSHMQVYIKAEPTTHIATETRTLAMTTCANLIKLEPKLSEAEVFDLVQVCTDSLFPLSPTGLPVRKNKEESPSELLETEAMMNEAFTAMHDVFKELISKDCTPSSLEEIFKHLVPWILSEHEHERERVLTTWLVIQKFYLEILKIKSPQILDNEGIFLARLVPRCSDPVTNIRQLAIDNIHVTLQIALRHEGNPAEQKDAMVDALPTLKERLKKSDPNVLFSVVNDLSKVIAKKLPADCLVPFIETLQQGLLDPQSHSSSGACVVLNGILKLRGAEIRPKVEVFLEVLYEKLCQIQCPQTKTGTLRSIRTMAAHHLLPTLTSLLTYPLPFDENVVEIWKILAQDSNLTSQTLEHFLELLLKSLPYEEKPDPRDKERKIKTATVVPLAVTYAFTEIFKVPETQENVLRLFPRLFAALIVRIGSSVAAKAPKEKKTETQQELKGDKKKKVVEKKSTNIIPIEVSINAMKTFLEQTEMTDMLEQLQTSDAWSIMEDEVQYPEAITLLARALINEEKETHIADIVNSLTSVLSSLYESQRITVAAFFAELINQKCKGDGDLVQLIMNSLLGRLVDESHIVRMLCVRGLGNIASVGKEQVQTYATTILSAMMAGMDDKEDPEDFITIEAMSGLSRILGEIQEEHIRAILINVSLKIRPCLEKEKCAVRAQAFRLFGNLSRFGDGPSKAPFLEQIHSNFISLLLHLNDKEDEVKQACKFALRHLGPLMRSEVINDKFQRHLVEDGHLHYGEFMNDLSKLIIQELSEKINFYVMGCVSFFKSPWPEIKSNAAMFVGFLLGNLPKDMQVNITKEHICSALILLLKDSSPLVRAKAAEAMSLLHDY